jgi:hypothetical protein
MDINQLLFELSETDVLVEAKLSDQERVAIDKALAITSIELAHIRVKSDWGKEYSIKRPLIRMYAPILIRSAVINRNLDVQIKLDSERFKGFVVKQVDDRDRMKSVFAILKSADKAQLISMKNGGEKVVILQAQVLQIKHIESETQMYPIKIGVPDGVFISLCEKYSTGPEDMIEKILGN